MPGYLSPHTVLAATVKVSEIGGAYIKLIGVPFRKLYDEDEALAELKAHRHSAMDLVGWEALVKITTQHFKIRRGVKTT
ncbi:hypothetical protein COOONC_21426 [Cooperia oncophora]